MKTDLTAFPAGFERGTRSRHTDGVCKRGVRDSWEGQRRPGPAEGLRWLPSPAAGGPASVVSTWGRGSK